MSKLTDMKLDELAKQEGYKDVDAMIDARGTDSVVPGICMNPECDYTCEVEPDQDRGYCEDCEKGTVKSFLILLEVI